MSEPIVFLGPTLDLGSARSRLCADYRPPIKRGDLGRISPETEIVGIVDGEFHQNLAVSPKEVIAILDRGVTVLGAASIGALRAVETASEGMIGVGSIYEMYRSGEIDGDDEVAVAYCPSSYHPVSDPLVNIRFMLRAAIVQKAVSRTDADLIIRTLKETYFPLRTFQLVLTMCPSLASFLKSERFDQKRDDALLLLSTIADRQRESMPSPPDQMQTDRLN